jgi:hypothetical protein
MDPPDESAFRRHFKAWRRLGAIHSSSVFFVFHARMDPSIRPSAD